jgi:sec-independent protein translocase protein TatC
MAASDVEQDHVGVLGGGADDLPQQDGENEGATMTLVEHLEELRRRLFVCAIAVAGGAVLAFIFWKPIYSFLLTPLPAEANSITHDNKLVILTVGGGFTVVLKLSLAVGLAVGAPVVLHQLWGFISPGLTRRERRYAGPFTALGGVLFVIGIAVGFLVLRYPVEWLLGFGKDQFHYILDANAYFTFVAYFLLAFGVTFELPLVLTFLSLVGIVSSRLLREKRKYAWFGLWFLACFITPGADPYSPVIIGASMTGLYELSVIMMRMIGK